MILLTAVAARGYVYFALVSFIPLLEQRVRGHGADHGARVLTLLLATGAAGTLIFGPLADKVGRRKMLLWSFVAVRPDHRALPRERRHPRPASDWPPPERASSRHSA